MFLRRKFYVVRSHMLVLLDVTSRFLGIIQELLYSTNEDCISYVARVF